MLSIKTPIRFLEAIFLDILTIPGGFMSKERNARYHLKYVRPLCSKWRKSFRNFDGKNKCLWYEAWEKGKFNVSRKFGFMNTIRYYFGLRTNLTRYEKEFKLLVLD